MTPGDLITLALKQAGVIGVGQTAAYEDTNDALNIMNMMLGQWSAKRYLVYHLIDTAFTSTGAESYTVGTGENFNITRPQQIEYAYARLNSQIGGLPVDYPLTELPSYEDYAALTLKSLSTFPSAFFYDPGYPIGTIYFWPIPSTQFELHILTKATLTAFTNLNTTINLAPEYQEALMWNLAGRLRPMYGMGPDETITGLARASLATLRAENSAIPLLQMPDSLPGMGGMGGGYNIYSDQGN